MQGFDWDDLRFVLALHRAGALASAGRALGVDETTVSRRLRRLEAKLGATLFHRTEAGRHEPSDLGLDVIARAERIEAESLEISELAGLSGEEMHGVVRITSTPVIVNRILVPGLTALRRTAPALVVELIPEARNLSLSRRETDIAVRLARPLTGGLSAKARRVGTMRYNAYEAARSDAEASPIPSPGWIFYAEGFAHLPQAHWTAQLSQPAGADVAPLRVADAETALEAAASGAGRALLPARVAEGDPRLRRCVGLVADAGWEREVWTVALTDQRARRSVKVALDWLEGIDWSPSDRDLAGA